MPRKLPRSRDLAQPPASGPPSPPAGGIDVEKSAVTGGTQEAEPRPDEGHGQGTDVPESNGQEEPKPLSAWDRGMAALSAMGRGQAAPAPTPLTAEQVGPAFWEAMGLPLVVSASVPAPTSPAVPPVPAAPARGPRVKAFFKAWFRVPELPLAPTPDPDPATKTTLTSVAHTDMKGVGGWFLWVLAGIATIIWLAWLWIVQRPVTFFWKLADAYPRRRLAFVVAASLIAGHFATPAFRMFFARGGEPVGKSGVAVIAKQEPAASTPAPVVEKPEPAASTPAPVVSQPVANKPAAAVSRPAAPVVAAKVDAKPAMTRLDWADVGGPEILRLGDLMHEAVIRLEGDPEALKATILGMKGRLQHAGMWGEAERWPGNQVIVHLEVDRENLQSFWQVVGQLRRLAAAQGGDKPVKVDMIHEGIKPPASKQSLAKS